MASTVGSGSLVYERRVIERVHKYHWPAVQLNFWMLIMLVASCLIIGVFATMIEVNNALLLSIPWFVPLPPLLVRQSLKYYLSILAIC
jgi:hypothetical protein